MSSRQQLPLVLLLLLLVLLLFRLPPARGTRTKTKGNAFTVKTELGHEDGCRRGEVEYRHRGDLFCYSLTAKLPFAHALAACHDTGGRLATVYSQQHNDLLYGMLTESAFIGAVARKHMLRHPFGDFGPGVIWSWMSGEEPEFNNVLERETRGFYNQPDGGGFEGCMELMKHPVLKDDPGNGFWGDTDCRARKPAICARKGYLKRPTVEGPNREWQFQLRRERRAGCPESFSRLAVKRLGERDSRSTCLSRRQAADDFSAAALRCQQLDPTATLARPARLAGRRRWTPSHGAGETRLLWSGADRRNSALRWRWQEDDRDVRHHVWAAGEPRDRPDSHCAAYDPVRRGMVATNCQTKLEFLCESTPHGCPTGYHVSASGLGCVRDKQNGCKGAEDYTGEPKGKACTVRLCPLACPIGYFQLGLKCLMINNTASWFLDIGRRCQLLGMDVMQPLSQTENEFLRRQTGRIGRPLWISTEVSSFSRWHRYVSYGLPHEPNEPTKGRHTTCSIIWFDGDWMDVDCFGEFPLVCERRMLWKDCAAAVQMLKST